MEDRKNGILMSPTRGLVKYDALSDTFEDVNSSDSLLTAQNVFPRWKYIRCSEMLSCF